MLPADIVVGKPGKLAVQRYGSQDTMEPELVFFDQINPVGGNRRYAAFPGKGIAAGHLKAGGHFYIEIISAIPLEYLEEFRIIGKNNEPVALFSDFPDQVEAVITMAGGNNSAKIGISLRGFNQQDRTPFPKYEFAPHDRRNAPFLCCLEKKD
jgi:hypothetical protein